jgi:hypothetical protein
MLLVGLDLQLPWNLGLSPLYRQLRLEYMNINH